VQTLLAQGQLQMGHARCLLALEKNQQESVAQKIVAQNLSVRAAEQLVKQTLEGNPTGKKTAPQISAELASIQQQLANKLDTSIKIQENAKGRGKLVISYADQQHLQKLLEKMHL
jgi:ParB family chromosome partitioning protein